MLKSYKNCILGAIFAATTFLSTLASASVITYTDRTAFQAALASFTVDSLNGIQQYSKSGNIVRSGYTINTPLMYGCVNHIGCGNNAGIGFDSSYLWNYQGLDTFTFASAVNGFGFDYANPTCCSSGTKPVLNGINATNTSGFFGIISSTALTSFTLDQIGSYMLIDNITFGSGTPSSVPEPSSIFLLGLGLLGLGFARKRK